MLLKAIFLLNLYCALKSCDLTFNQPEISSPLTRSDELLFEEHPDPLVRIPGLGLIEGFKMKSTTGRPISAFEGVRFALPPTGQRRFRDPVPSGPWTGTLEAKAPGEYCTQLHLVKMMRVVGQEDCLFLNIYVPKLLSLDLEEEETATAEKYPVIIYFHGGSFLFGSGFEYGPSYLLDRDLILVTINWRMGILGFLSTGDEESVGNYGLKDQTLAMKWVFDHIASFGGNPNKITIMGQSAGAASVHLHLISNSSRPYFQAGVSLSGSAMVNWGVALRERALANAHRMARLVGCPTHNSRELVNCFRNTHSYTLVGHQASFFEWLIFPPVIFGPVVEPPNPGAFLTRTPDEVYDRGEVAKYPWIVSLMEDEGMSGIYVMKLAGMINRIRRRPEKYLPLYLDYKYLGTNEAQITSKISSFYFGGKSMWDVPISAFIDMQSDRYFVYGLEKAMKAHSKLGAPTYAYLFTYISKYNMGRMLGQPETELGVGHGEDMFFYFNASIYSHGFQKADPEYLLSQIMINLLSNFAQKREPLYTNADGSDVDIWDRIQGPEQIQFLSIGKDIHMIGDPFRERFFFWEDLGLKDFPPFHKTRFPPTNYTNYNELY